MKFIFLNHIRLSVENILFLLQSLRDRFASEIVDDLRQDDLLRLPAPGAVRVHSPRPSTA